MLKRYKPGDCKGPKRSGELDAALDRLGWTLSSMASKIRVGTSLDEIVLRAAERHALVMVLRACERRPLDRFYDGNDLARLKSARRALREYRQARQREAA